MTGKVKFINEEKGFGFIKPSGAGDDIFVHSSGIIDDIYEQDRVEFDVQQGRKGLSAINVRVLNSKKAQN